MGIKLVIVDDAPFMREVMRHIVSEAEIEVVGEAETGSQAVNLILEKKPDVVLMDIIMPEMTGLEATKVILKERPETRIIACSTESNEDMVLQALEAGCCNFVSKPFQVKELIGAIQASVKESKGE